MRTHEQFLRSRPRAGLAGAVALAAVALAALPLGSASAGSGGIGASTTNCARGGDAKLSDGRAVPPCDAPFRVKRVIRAANEIAKGKGYCWGGGHSSWNSPCYDCSGALSYALHGGDLLDSPLDSSGLARWGRAGGGRWITVFANSGHAYMVVAGLRFDTSMTPGAGPGWSSQMRSADGYARRHKGRL